MKKICVVLFVALLFAPAAMAKKVGDIEVADSIMLDGQNLVLNGAGVRIKKIAFITIDVYTAGLYLKTKSTDPQAIMDENSPMAIRLYITTNKATKEKLIDAWNEGFERATGGKTDGIKSEITKFNALFKTDPKDGDLYEIAYVPDKGITVALNGVIQGDAIAGLEFKKAVFGIWLAKNTDEYLNKLKTGLLGL